MATRSPALHPRAIKPNAAERIWSAACAHVTSVQIAVDQALEDDEVGIVALVLEDRGGDVVVLADGEAGRDTVTHALV